MRQPDGGAGGRQRGGAAPGRGVTDAAAETRLLTTLAESDSPQIDSIRLARRQSGFTTSDGGWLNRKPTKKRACAQEIEAVCEAHLRTHVATASCGAAGNETCGFNKIRTERNQAEPSRTFPEDYYQMTLTESHELAQPHKGHFAAGPAGSTKPNGNRNGSDGRVARQPSQPSPWWCPRG